jgi:DNA-binding protein YbaB
MVRIKQGINMNIDKKIEKVTKDGMLTLGKYDHETLKELLLEVQKETAREIKEKNKQEIEKANAYIKKLERITGEDYEG